MVIVLLSILFSSLIFFVTEIILFRVFAVGISFYFFHFANLLIQAIPSKIRSIAILLHKNRNQTNPHSFEKYMSTPCGRQVAKITLQKLMRLDIYKTLKRDTSLNIFSFKKTQTRIVYYKNGENIN
jgi:hypothetical protein